MSNINEQNIVAQSNPLVRGRKKDGITVREQKILYTVISMIDRYDEELKEYRINVRQLFKLSGVAQNTPSKSLKETADKLTTRNVELPIINSTNPNDFEFMGIVSRCRYVDKEGELIVVLNPEIKPYLLKLQGDFTSYKLFNILKLKSEYSISLFQYFKSYAHKGKVTVSLEHLRRFLFNEEKVYEAYTYFKRDILKKCINEINKKTDIEVTFEEIKVSRKVEALVFYIKDKDVMVSPQNLVETKIWDDEKVHMSLIIDTLRKDGIEVSATDGAKLAEKAIALWGKNTDELLELLAIVRSQKANLKSPIGYLKHLFSKCEANVANQLVWNYGLSSYSPQSYGRTEYIPEWFCSREEEQPPLTEKPSTPSEDVQTAIEKAKQKLLAVVSTDKPKEVATQQVLDLK